MEKRVNRSVKLYPWYAGFTGDLLFYIAIDTLFLTVVKNFSAAQIVSITSFSQLICIALQFPVLFLIKKIGNTASIRLGALSLLVSSILITLGPSYAVVLFGVVFREISLILYNASLVAMENNLDLLDRREDFVRVRTSANTVYSVITLLISLVVSYLFNLNHYLPMIGCITTCTIGFVLSLFIKDHSDYNRIPRQRKRKTGAKLRCSRLILLVIVIYGIVYSVINNGQIEGKLFLQQQALLSFDVEQTAWLIGMTVCVSRLARVLSNLIFARLYGKYRAKIGIAVALLFVASIGFQLFGSLIPTVTLKIAVMAIGYVLILFSRDPFNLYVQEVVFANTPKEQHQTLLTVLSLASKVATAGTGLAFSAVLLSYPMEVVMALLFAVTLVEVVLSLKLYGMVASAKDAAVNGE